MAEPVKTPAQVALKLRRKKEPVAELVKMKVQLAPKKKRKIKEEALEPDDSGTGCTF